MASDLVGNLSPWHFELEHDSTHLMLVYMFSRHIARWLQKNHKSQLLRSISHQHNIYCQRFVLCKRAAIPLGKEKQMKIREKGGKEIGVPQAASLAVQNKHGLLQLASRVFGPFNNYSLVINRKKKESFVLKILSTCDDLVELLKMLSIKLRLSIYTLTNLLISINQHYS